MTCTGDVRHLDYGPLHMSSRVCCWILPALLWSTLGVSPTAGALARIMVVVVDDAGAPVPAARVYLTGLTGPLHKVLEADAAGQAAFDNLPDGQFTLAAEKDGFVRGAFGPAGPSSIIPIALSHGTQFGATVVIQRVGTIAGLVSDSKGDPTAAEVRVFRYAGGQGPRRLQVVASSRSTASGAFRFPTMAPGEYFVCARATPTAEATLMPVPACFGGSREPSGAAVVRVIPAEVVGNVTLYLTSEPGARLQGVLLDANGQPAVSTQIHVVGAIDDGFGTTPLRTGPSGQFSATLLPGTYNLVVPGAGAMEVTLSAGSPSEVLFPLGRGANLSGKVAFGGAGGKSILRTGTTLFELVPVASGYAHLMAKIPVRLTDADSLTFGATGIPSGRYQVRVGSAVTGWLAASALAGDRDLLTDGVHIFGADPVTDLSLVLVRADAQVTGRVLDSNDVPVFDRKVLVFPADRRHWPSGFGRVRWAQPDTNGGFEIAGLPAGRFLLAVIADSDQDEVTPALLEAAAAGALLISIQPGQRVVQAVRTTTR